MKKLSTVLVILAILVVGVGFYQGWFAISRPASEAGSSKVNINLAADPEKMTQDAQLIKDKATELTSGVTDDDQVEGQEIDIVRSNSP
jgi:hypothetical protein